MGGYDTALARRVENWDLAPSDRQTVHTRSHQAHAALRGDNANLTGRKSYTRSQRYAELKSKLAGKVAVAEEEGRFTDGLAEFERACSDKVLPHSNSAPLCDANWI